MGSDNCAQYEYTSLENPTSQIRLLEVFHDGPKSNNQIECRLTVWDITNAPSYHAISYTWGREKPTEYVHLDGTVMAVRKNCADVLRQLLYFKSSRYYWIDALCIDQSSVNERNHQVARMGRIYSDAAHVLVCLCEDGFIDAEYAFSIISRLWEYYFPRTSKGLPVEPIERLPLHGFYSFPGMDTARFALSLEALTRHTYFTRVWIVQELVLAQHVSMYCGRSQLPVLYPHTDLIFRAAAAYKTRTYDTYAKSATPETSDLDWAGLVTTRNREDRRIVHLLEQRWQYLKHGVTLSFSEALEIFSSLQCKDPRDMVYSTLGLIDWRRASPIEPDYGKSKYDLATECFELLHNQRYFSSVENREKFATTLRNMSVGAFVGQGAERWALTSRGLWRSEDPKSKFFAFPDDGVGNYGPTIWLPMTGKLLSDALRQSQTISLSYNGRCVEISYPDGPDRPCRDFLEMRKSDWILTSRQYGHILVRRSSAIENHSIQIWNIVGRVGIQSSSDTELAFDSDEGKEFIMRCNPSICSNPRPVGSDIHLVLETVECYGYAASML